MTTHDLETRSQRDRTAAGRPEEITPATEAALRACLRRCGADVVAAACEFRRSRAGACLPVIVAGVIESQVERPLRGLFRSAAPDGLRLKEDLALDSLSLMEIAMLIEEVLQVVVDNEELRGLHTVGHVQAFVAAKVRDGSTRSPFDRGA